MGQSYRIRTTPGADKNIVIDINQDFEQLEILSLKIRQDDVYLRSCSNYGVIAGRVFANDGYGIPNAKISIFIPVSDEDLRNPNINSIYPYKSLSEKNEDGYRYNLLPYTPSYFGHAATGTFPTRLDNLINQTAVEIYDKYYKYSVETNNSGDYLIYGVPVGTQTIVMNLDLSDMGQFSMDPQDLIRLGLATENQFNGNKFNASPNLETLPQIVILNKVIEVVPFWGENDICQVGITRTDFDITGEANIKIEPTAVFMGSIFSMTSDVALKVSCKAKQATGNKCRMLAGPGEIIAITQSIYNDENGLPILQKANLPNGGKLIDTDGTWLFDLPMNYNYVTTNEFGEQVLSNDPKVGVPTKAKYRFKFKWQQSKSISEDIKRGYYLVPNIKEKGWVGTGISGTTNDPLTGVLGLSNYEEAVQSYAFDLNWSAYTSGPLNLTNTELLSYINCEDRFYEFDYNKVYTVSSFIDNLKRMKNRDRFLAIKRIEEETCDATVNKFPVNDGVFHTSIFWVALNILINIIGFLGYIIIPLYHILAGLVHLIWCLIVAVICAIMTVICFIISLLLFLFTFKWNFDKCLPQICKEKSTILGGFKLPMITYPDCETCDCEQDSGTGTEVTKDNQEWQDQVQQGGGLMFAFNESYSYGTILQNEDQYNTFVSNAIPYSQKNDLMQILGGLTGTGANQMINAQVGSLSTNDLQFGERINKFNVKGNYYDSFGGTNQIKVTLEPTANPGKYHYDNTVTFVTGQQGANLKSGDMFTFVNPILSADKNITEAPLNSYGTKNLTGTTITASTLTVSYSNITSPFIGNLTTIYNTPTLATNITSEFLYSYPSDVEYYQVITAVTVNQYLNIMNMVGTLTGSFADILTSTMSITGGTSVINPMVIDAIDKNNSYVLICQRGVDPYSPRINTKYELGKIFGYSSYSAVTVNGDFRINIPVQNNTINTDEILFNHSAVTDNATQNNGLNLYYSSYFFIPNSTNYQPYNTNLHSYYSSMDYNLVNSGTFSIYSNNLNNTNTQLGPGIPFPYSKQVRSLTTNKYYDSINPVSDKKYTNTSQLQGGSYMFYNPPFSIYFSPAYSGSITLTMSDSSKIVMRSDRLPTSDSQLKNGNNTYCLQQNSDTKIYSYGQTTANVATTGITAYNTDTPYYGDNTDDDSSNSIYNNVLDTFSCENMVSLTCYTQTTNGIIISPGCNKNRVVNGCYKFCPECDCGGNFASCDISCIFGPFTSIGADWRVWGEYILRFKFMFALCQDVLSEVFNNNWINGTLFAFPFRINTYYNNQNEVSSRSFCTNAVMLHPTTNNFYYRSTPWNGTDFIGQRPTWSFVGQEGQNTVNIKFPTTVLNMGPKDAFLSEVILNGNYAGYNMDNISDTSYQDTSEITNLFVLLRLINESFLRALIDPNKNNRTTIQGLFSRSGKKVDADFAQMAAINSQLGIIPFDSENYSTVPPNQPVIVTGTGPGDRMMGIFFSATTDSIQYRDLISPVRLINWNKITNNFTYDYLSVKTQLTPHYQWTVQFGGSSIFGTQKNNWATNYMDLVKINYQGMDRLYATTIYGQNSPYQRYNYTPNQYNARGYMYADDSNVFTAATYNTTPLYSSYPNPSETNSGKNTLVGAPWYFYFGLIKGSTAMNKFYTKYIGEITLND